MSYTRLVTAAQHMGALALGDASLQVFQRNSHQSVALDVEVEIEP